MDTTTHKNRLAAATSPYLLAHADNPVDWYQWGDEAFEKAETEDKPIFLSIGYNACHWCHVMEHESFENEEIAALLNKYFVSIKVDREERPDIDQIYMTAVQAMTGSGGWPMSVFLTPDRRPFFGGTYFPPESAYGRPGFKEVLTSVAQAYRERHREIVNSAESVYRQLEKSAKLDYSGRTIDGAVLDSAGEMLLSSLDLKHGGFGHAPKFPHAGDISVLFRLYHLTGNERYRDGALLTLRKMAQGGIYDHLGGGFARYSVDELWLVPHFEKMLYDNALLVVPYLEAYQITGDAFYLDVVNGTLTYLQKKMTDPEGGIYSTQDADSEGEEGRYYVWARKEVQGVLGDDADWFCTYYGISEEGNFEGGKSILHMGDHSEQVVKQSGLPDGEFKAKLDKAKSKLLAAREKRVPPATDDKILASWNGLAISAFAQAYQVTQHDSYLASARKAADFVLKNLQKDGKLYHSFRKGSLLETELLEDYAFFISGLLDLYQASFDETYLRQAKRLTQRAIDSFYSDSSFYSTPAGTEDLLYRPQEVTDSSTPAPASVMIFDLLRLGAITSDTKLLTTGKDALASVSGLASRAPLAAATLLQAGYFASTGTVEIVVVGDDESKPSEFSREIFSRYIPNKIVVGNLKGESSSLPLLEGRQDAKQLTFYLCRDNSCRLPVTDLEGLRKELEFVTRTQ